MESYDGKVHQLNNKAAIKGLFGEGVCISAKEEFEKQQIIWESFYSLSRMDKGGFSTKAKRALTLVEKYVKISRPLSSCNRRVIINEHEYDYSFSMELLNGVPIQDYIDIIGDSEAFNLSDDYLNCAGEGFQPMLHLSSNSEIPSKFFTNIYTQRIIHCGDPLRGFFMSLDEIRLLEGILDKYNSELTVEDIALMMGFIYGWIYYATEIISRDIEITLGVYNGEVKVNVLDFGATVDMRNLDTLERSPQNYDLYTLVDKYPPGKDRDMAIDEYTQILLAQDIYAYLERDIHGDHFVYMLNVEGWDLAKKAAGYL